MALGPRSLRTKKLTERVPTFAPRTVYRHARQLASLGLIDREEVAGVPSTVIHSLSPAGRDLYRLLDGYEKLSPKWASAPARGDGLWSLCGLLGEMWGYGWIDELSQTGRSATDLAEATAAMTFHQTSRRTHQMLSWGLLHENVVRGTRRRFHLSDQARHGMFLVAGLGRWRQDHVDGGHTGLTAPEMATILRTSLHLLNLPDRPSSTVKLGIVGATGNDGANGSEALTAHVSENGLVRNVKDRMADDGWALGTVDTWLAALLDGNRGKMRVGGDQDLVEHFLKQMHAVLSAVPAIADGDGR
jgi:DNA-binding HxlR family transcriptional regulator